MPSLATSLVLVYGRIITHLIVRAIRTAHRESGSSPEAMSGLAVDEGLGRKTQPGIAEEIQSQSSIQRSTQHNAGFRKMGDNALPL